MPKCKNSNNYYTGKEPSPKGFGLCGSAMPLGTKAEGTDRNMWIITEDRAGRRSWKLMTQNKPTTKKTTDGKKSKMQQYSVVTRYPRSNSVSRLTKSETSLAKKNGVVILNQRIVYEDFRNASTLSADVRAKTKADVERWLSDIGATPVVGIKVWDDVYTY